MLESLQTFMNDYGWNLLTLVGFSLLMLVSLLIIVPGTALFAAARRRAGERVFTPGEWVAFALTAAGAAAALILLATGAVTL